MATKYKATVITAELYDKVREFVRNSNGRYVSITEVVREALWIFLKTK